MFLHRRLSSTQEKDRDKVKGERKEVMWLGVMGCEFRNYIRQRNEEL